MGGSKSRLGGCAIKEVIVTCGCSDTDKFAQDAFRILFSNKAMPSITHRVSHNEPQLLREYVNALTKNVEKFAYYFSYDSSDIEAWDLLKGIRIL